MEASLYVIKEIGTTYIDIREMSILRRKSDLLTSFSVERHPQCILAQILTTFK